MNNLFSHVISYQWQSPSSLDGSVGKLCYSNDQDVVGAVPNILVLHAVREGILVFAECSTESIHPVIRFISLRQL